MHIFGELVNIFGESVHIFHLETSFPEPRNKFREIWGHYGNRGFTMILLQESKKLTFRLLSVAFECRVGLVGLQVMP